MRNGTTKFSKASSVISVRITQSAILGCPMKPIRSMRLGRRRSNGNSQGARRRHPQWPLIGGTILIRALADDPPRLTFRGIFLIAAPFVGDGGWHSEDIEPFSDLGAKLPEQTPIYLYHGSKDTTALFEHVQLYATAIPQAVVRRLSGRDHQLNNDMSEVAGDIRRLGAVRVSPVRDNLLGKIAGERAASSVHLSRPTRADRGHGQPRRPSTCSLGVATKRGCHAEQRRRPRERRG